MKGNAASKGRRNTSSVFENFLFLCNVTLQRGVRSKAQRDRRGAGFILPYRAVWCVHIRGGWVPAAVKQSAVAFA